MDGGRRPTPNKVEAASRRLSGQRPLPLSRVLNELWIGSGDKGLYAPCNSEPYRRKTPDSGHYTSSRNPYLTRR
jgi:hypothetical protein